MAGEIASPTSYSPENTKCLKRGSALASDVGRAEEPVAIQRRFRGALWELTLTGLEPREIEISSG